MKYSSRAIFVLFALAMAATKKASAAICSPSSCNTLEELVEHVKSKMPLKDSELFVAPGQQVMDDWEHVIQSMLSGNCSAALLLPTSLSSTCEIEAFIDGNNTEQEYCVLAATADTDNDGVVDSPWGTVIVNQDIFSRKPMSIQVPHPLHDSNTAEQGIAVFKGTNATSFVLSGSHRHATSETSSCQGSYEIADAAHNIGTFQASMKAITAYNDEAGIEEHTSIQFHGMGSSSCPGVDAYFTHGSDIPPQNNEKIDLLRQSLEEAVPGNTHTFTVPGDSPSCSLTGTTNVQGRLINGVAPESVCGTEAYAYSGKFIHIEQKSWLRAESSYDYWITAINSVDFADAEPPTGFTITSPNGGESIGLGTEATITWDSSGVSSGSDVKLSLHENDIDFTYVKTIAQTAPNTGSYSWVVPGSTATGNNFVVRVRSVDNTDIKDYSDTSFSVVNPINVIYPNGGETLAVGDDVDVTWSAPGIGNVKLSLHEGSGYSYKRTIATETTNDGIYTWTVPSLTPGTDYAVRVRSVDDTSVKAYSAGMFTIIQG